MIYWWRCCGQKWTVSISFFFSKFRLDWVCCCRKNRTACGSTTGARRAPCSSTRRRWTRRDRDRPERRGRCSSTKCRPGSPSASSTTNVPCSTNKWRRWSKRRHLRRHHRRLRRRRRRPTPPPTDRSTPTPCASVSPRAGVPNIHASSSPLALAGSKCSWLHRLGDAIPPPSLSWPSLQSKFDNGPICPPPPPPPPPPPRSFVDPPSF